MKADQISPGHSDMSISVVSLLSLWFPYHFGHLLRSRQSHNHSYSASKLQVLMPFEEPQSHIDAMLKTLNEAKTSSGLGADDPAVIELERIMKSRIAELQTAELQAQTALLQPVASDSTASADPDAGVIASLAADAPIVASEVASLPVAVADNSVASDPIPSATNTPR